MTYSAKLSFSCFKVTKMWKLANWDHILNLGRATLKVKVFWKKKSWLNLTCFKLGCGQKHSQMLKVIPLTVIYFYLSYQKWVKIFHWSNVVFIATGQINLCYFVLLIIGLCWLLWKYSEKIALILSSHSRCI